MSKVVVTKAKKVPFKQKLKREGHEWSVSLRRHHELYFMILPVIIYFIIFAYWPMYGIQIAFKDFSPALGFAGSEWVGLKHLRRFFNSYYFGRLIKNTIGISVYGLLIGIPAPIFLAILFNEIKNKKKQVVLQALSYAPHFMSTVVVCGMILMVLSTDSGIIPAIMRLFGAEVEKSPIANPTAFWHIYVWSGVWQGIGWSSLIYTATISGIPENQYEAAVIEGATKLQQTNHITLPNLLPTIIILSILSAGSIMNVGYEKVYLLQNDSNLATSEVISTYVYKSGLKNAQYSFAAMIGLFNNIINFFILVFVNKVSNKLTETSLW